MKVDEKITLEDDSEFLLLSESVIENQKYFLAVEIKNENPTDHYELFKEVKDGDAKMSSSKGNFIAVDDSVEDITKKIKKSYCPQGEIEDNPMIEIALTFVFPNQEKLLIKRPEKFGGDIELTKEELLKNFGNARFVRNMYEKTVIKHAANTKGKKIFLRKMDIIR